MAARRKNPCLLLIHLALAGLALACAPALAQVAQANAPSYSFGVSQLGAASQPVVTAQFTVTGYTGTFIPTATLQYGKSFAAGTVSCTPISGGETCSVPVTFAPQYPGARRDTLYIMNGSMQLAGTFLYGIGQSPLALMQPGITTSMQFPGGPYIYIPTVDENKVAYVQANSQIFSVANGVATALPGSSTTSNSNLSVDAAGNIFISDLSNSYGGVYSLNTGTQQPIQFNIPPNGTYHVAGSFDIEAGNAGTFYVANPGESAGAINGYVAPELMIANNYGENLTNLNQNPGTLLYSSNASTSQFGPDSLAVDSYENIFASGSSGIFEICSLLAGTGSTCGTAGSMTLLNNNNLGNNLSVDAAETLYTGRYNGVTGVAMLPASNYAAPEASIDSGAPLGSAVGPDGTVYVGNYQNFDIIDRSQGAIYWGSNNGAVSNPQTITMYNGGNEPLTISAIAISGPGYALATAASGPCVNGTVLSPGAICAIGVTSTPPHNGTLNGLLTVSSNSLNNASTVQNVALSGYVSGIYVTAGPSPLPFGFVASGGSVTLPVTVSNTSAGSNSVGYGSTVSITSPLTSSNSAFTAALGTCNAPLASGSSCQLQVTFSPVGSETPSGTISWTEAIGGGPSQALSVTVNGTSVPPLLMVPIAETIHTSDSPAVTPALLVPIVEMIHTSDTPMFPLVVPITETVHISDVPAAVAGTPTKTSVMASAPSAYVAQSVVLTATVGAVGGTPAGTVNFYDGATLIATAALGNGAATATVSFSQAGMHSITASYAGSAQYGASSSSATAVTVSMDPSSTALAINPATVAVGSLVVMQARTTTPYDTPAGLVNFYDGTNLIATSMLVNGAAQTAVFFSTAGQHSITAVYAGSAAAGTSTSPAVSVTATLTTPTITWAPIPNLPLPVVKQIALIATSSSGAPVTFTVNSGPAQVSGLILHLNGTGPVTVTAYVPACAGYNAASLTQTFTVTQ